MWDLLEDFWRTAWAVQSRPLDERLKGLVVLLLFVSVSAALLGGLGSLIESVGSRRRRKREIRAGDVATETDEEADEEGAEQAPRAWGRTRGLLRAFCQNLPLSVGASIVCFLLLALLGLRPSMRLCVAAAALPSVLVLLQYVHLWAHKPRPLEEDQDEKGARDKEKERAYTAVESMYGPRTLFIRYGFPALLLFVESLCLAFALIWPETWLPQHWDQAGLAPVLAPATIRGARYGAMGAYTWVIVELGRRSFRRDVTSGLAVWSIVTLAVGPILAALLSLVWLSNNPKPSEWQVAVVLFYAGYAPRNVLSVVGSAAAQLLRIGPTPSVETRTTPLTKIRGINAQIEERLGEEGIYNAETLATVEPIRLMRDTSFDLRTILWWVDEALLMMYAPQRWQLLEEQGLTGAVDLADLASEKPGNDAARTKAAIDSLAKVTTLESALLVALADRVYRDRQVNYVYYLYNYYTTDGQSPAENAETKPAAISTAGNVS